MKVSRALVVTTAGVGYPALVAVMAAGIMTFTAAKVFAESAAPPPLCSEPSITKCGSASEQCTDCGWATCGCLVRSCFDDAGTIQQAPQCVALVSCDEARFKDCAGKAAGESCGEGKSCSVVQDLPGCHHLDGGAWTYQAAATVCGPSSVGASSDSGATDEGGAGTSKNDGGGDGGTSSSNLTDDDSGCSLGGVGVGQVPALSPLVAISLALLSRARRRSRR